MKKIESKWERIARGCRALGLKEAAVLADEIEEGLRALYDTTITQDWTYDYKRRKMNNTTANFDIIYDVTNKVDYCIACERIRQAPIDQDTPWRCSGCLFGELYGICMYKESLFQRFVRALSGDEE